MKRRIGSLMAPAVSIVLAGAAFAQINQKPAEDTRREPADGSGPTLGPLGNGPRRPPVARPGLSTKIDPVRQAAWEAAQAQAAQRVNDFDAAVKSGDAARIRKAALDLGSDPIAVQKLNQGSSDLINAHNQVNEGVRSQARQNIRENVARDWNASHPDQQIKPGDVEIYEPTNYRDPSAKPKAPQDWDVTVKVNGKDLPTSQSRGAVEQGFYDAAGGKDTFGEHSTPREAAHRQSIETTSGKSPEAYNEPDKILGRPGQPPDPNSRLNDPEQLTHAINNKSDVPRNNAADAREPGGAGEVEAVRNDFEEMRQASKQYDRITKPRVEAGGGQVNSHVDEGMNIMRDVGEGRISPEEGRARLAEMGETPESLRIKAGGQVEAGQKLGAGRTGVTDTPEGTARSPTETPEGAPGAARNALEKIGKGMQAVDILSGAEDFKNAAKKGDTEGMKNAAVNTADALAGGPIATVKTVGERGEAGVDTVSTIAQGYRAANEANDLAIQNDLRKGGFSKEQVAAIMDARAKGDEGPLKDGYAKIGKEIPKPMDIVPTVGDVAKGYINQVGENTVEVGKGIVDKTVKAGKFVKEATEDVGEIAGGLVTDKATRNEVINQVKDNVSADNLKAGLDARNLNNKADADREGARKDLENKLVGKGASRDDARDAVNAWDQGDRTAVANLRDRLAGKTAKAAGAADKTGVRIAAQGQKEPTAADGAAAGGGESVAGGAGRAAAPADDGMPRNDAGDKVDAGRYGNGDMVVTKDGTEYANQGGQWVKTGNNYGPYKPEGGLGNEPKAGNADGGDKSSGDDRGGGLNGFTLSRNGRTEANTRDSLGLMAGQQNISQASTRGDAADRDAKNLINSAGRDAQDTRDKSAADAAAGDRANSWGNAVGNGIQQGIEKGVTAAGEAFGRSAADEASKSIFGGPKDDGKDPGAGAEGGQGAATVAGGSAGQQVSGGGGHSGGHKSGRDDVHNGHGGGTKVATRPPPKTIPTRGGGGGHGSGGGSQGGYSTGTAPGTSSGASDGSSGGGGTPPPPPTYTITCPACHRSFTVDTPGGHMCPFCVTMNCPKCGFSAVYDRGSEPAGCPSCAAKAAAAAAAAAAAGAK